jgi:hypothetical protein
VRIFPAKTEWRFEDTQSRAKYGVVLRKQFIDKLTAQFRVIELCESAGVEEE